MTGATGFVGRRMLRHLAARGAETTALVRDRSRSGPVEALATRLVVGDVRTGAGLGKALEGVDCVVHLAAAIKARSSGEFFSVNVEGTRRLCKAVAAASNRPRLVYCSSLSAAGPSVPGRPLREEDACSPISHYGRSKLGGEAVLREFAGRIDAAVVRPPVVYGPGDVEFLPAVAAMVRRGTVVTVGGGAHVYSLVYVDDLCAALVAVAERGATVCANDVACGVYYVSDGEQHTLEQMGSVVAHAMGVRVPRVVAVPLWAARVVARSSVVQARVRGRVTILGPDKVRELRHPVWTCDSAKISRELAFVPMVGLADGVGYALAGGVTAVTGVQAVHR
ncbi:NAD-dependent epimerase/dehydratase family protein [Kitasatospora herbaricolor]|uniref:NAD-dependent epimerase/dehydratase family protein n=1 Tax=Kitasatospora herbaricolor TaxID=68217 RepID=UPI0036DCB47A